MPSPNNCSLAQLKELCKKKRTFRMTCITESKRFDNEDRLKKKTVHIRDSLIDNK
jgi:hypothetical protein